jgi:hypothetical protein
MSDHSVVQASGAMFSTIDPDEWTCMFGVYVTTQDGTPVPGLKKKNFSVWKLSTIGELTIRLVTELNADFPDSKMPGIYRLKTTGMLGSAAPFPQEFVFALRVQFKRRKLDLLGMTTVPIT